MKKISLFLSSFVLLSCNLSICKYLASGLSSSDTSFSDGFFGENPPTQQDQILVENLPEFNASLFRDAITQQNQDLAKILIQKGKDQGAIFDEEQELLTIALKNKDIAMAKLLLKNEAATLTLKHLLSVAKTEKLEYEPFFYLFFRYCPLETIQHAEFQDRTFLSALEEYGDPKKIDFIKQMIKGISDPVDGAGNTLLHQACKEANSEKILLLLQKNADPTVSNKEGETPLVIAAKQGMEPAIIRALITKGAQNSPANDDSLTALRILCKQAALSYKQSGLFENKAEKIIKGIESLLTVANVNLENLMTEIDQLYYEYLIWNVFRNQDPSQANEPLPLLTSNLPTEQHQFLLERFKIKFDEMRRSLSPETEV